MYTNILAPFAARVTSVGTDASDSRGYHVYIEATDPRFTSFENGNPLRMVFMHMQSSPYVSYGSTIAAGTVLGQVGDTGDSTGPHLHVSLIVTGDAGQTINNTVIVLVCVLIVGIFIWLFDALANGLISAIMALFNA